MGPRRVLTALEQNAEYLDDYKTYIENIKYLNIETGEVELEKSATTKEILNLLDRFRGNEKIRTKLEKILIESNDEKSFIDYLIKFRYRIDKIKKSNDLSKIEKLISRDPRLSTAYAEILEGRFELGEKAISKDAECSIKYAEIIGARFELGEPAISEKNEYLYQYSRVLGKLPDELYNRMIANCL